MLLHDTLNCLHTISASSIDHDAIWIDMIGDAFVICVTRCAYQMHAHALCMKERKKERKKEKKEKWWKGKMTLKIQKSMGAI